MTFDHDFGYSFLLFSSLLKKREEEKENGSIKNSDQSSCLSARSQKRENSKCEIEKKGLTSDFTVCIMFCNL